MSDQEPADAQPTGAPDADPPAENAPAQPPAEPSPAKRAPAKKSAPKRGAKKATAKKTTAKKTTAKKTTAKKTAAKKASAKKAAAKKATAPGTTPAAEAPSAPAVAPAYRFPPDASELERPWLASYPPLVPESYPYPDVALTRLLDDAAKDFPDSLALDFLGRTTTYRRLADHVDRFATALHSMGLGPGERVGVALPNCPQHVIAVFATLRLGAVVVEIDPGIDPDALAARINDAGCRVLVVLDPVYAKVEQLKGRVPSVEHVIGTAVADYLSPVAAAAFNLRHRRNARLIRKIPPDEGVLRFTDLIRAHPPTATQARIVPADDVAVIAYPANASATPRGIMLTHRNLLASVFQVRLWIPDVQAGRETVLCAVPFWQSYGLTTGLLLGILSAAAMALAPSLDREDVLHVIEKRKPTLFPATAGLIERLVSAPHLRRHDLTSIRAALCDTSLLAPDVVEGFEAASGGRLREGLALEEATSLTHANPVYGKIKADHVGLPLSDTMCVLVDRDDPTVLAEPGTRGQLAVRGPQVMKGYWNDPAATAATLIDGWLLTGLLAEADADGYYSILGRSDGAAGSV